jgi:hypothetical protein
MAQSCMATPTLRCGKVLARYAVRSGASVFGERNGHRVTGRGKGRLEAQYGLLTSIATEAGVSLSTVSKVVHRRRDVGAATRDRVEELLARHGYVRPWERDPAAPRQIIAVFRDLSGPYTLEVVRGIVDAAGELGIDVVTGTTSRRSISGWLEECVALGAAGIVIVISMLAEEDQRRIVEQRLPVVLIDPLSAPSEDIPSIGVTNWSGARDAVQHLLGLGHTRIGMVAGRSHSLAGAARVHGYRAALEEAGVAYDPAIVRSTDFDYAEALPPACRSCGPTTRPRPSSRPATRRRSACWRPPGSRGSPYPTTWRSCPSTTRSWRPWPARR